MSQQVGAASLLPEPNGCRAAVVESIEHGFRVKDLDTKSSFHSRRVLPDHLTRLA